MQNAKDSFYMTLRNRLVAVNPERKLLLRGTMRPGILVEEAEAPLGQPLDDVFVLRWLGQAVDRNLDTVMVAEVCEIVYGSCGTQAFGGLDRGRLLSQMDEELLDILSPPYTRKQAYSVIPPVTMLTDVFWTSPEFSPVVTLRDRLSRSTRTVVYSYQEMGE